MLLSLGVSSEQIETENRTDNEDHAPTGIALPLTFIPPNCCHRCCIIVRYEHICP